MSTSTSQQWVPPDQPLSPPSKLRVTFSSVSAPSGSRSGSSLTILASSASESSTLGVPRTLMTPPPISRSAGLASSTSAASDSTCSRSCLDAWRTTPFAIVAARLPPVPTSAIGVTSVSPKTTWTSSNLTPSSSTATWASVVSWPWPCGCWRVMIWTIPSSSTEMCVTSSPRIALPGGAARHLAVRAPPRGTTRCRARGSARRPAPPPGGVGSRPSRRSLAACSTHCWVVTPTNGWPVSIASGGSPAVHVVAAADVDRVDPELAGDRHRACARAGSRPSPTARGTRRTSPCC